MGRDTKQLLDAAVINLLCNQYKSVRDLHVKVSDSVLVFDPLNTWKKVQCVEYSATKYSLPQE